METENNLGLGMDAWKGTDIEKGIYQDNLEKDLEKGFSETPEAKKEEGKPQPPTVAETHAGEMEAKALKQKETAAMDKKHSYDKMDSSHQKAIRVLLNIEGKSAKEKIETVMEQFGVSKMGAINILADATKELPKPEQPEGEKKEIEKSLEGGKADNMSIEDIAKKHRVEVSEIEKQLAMGLKVETEHTTDKAKAREIALDHLVESASYYTKLKTMESKDDLKKALDHTLDEIGYADNDLEKAVPIGTVNKYGKIKTADGWVYQKGQGSKGGAKTEAPKGEVSKTPLTDAKVKQAKTELAQEKDLLTQVQPSHAEKKEQIKANIKKLEAKVDKLSGGTANSPATRAKLKEAAAELGAAKAEVNKAPSKDSGNQDKIDHYTEMANDKNTTPQKRSYARKQIAKYTASGQSGNPQNEKKPEAKKEEPKGKEGFSNTATVPPGDKKPASGIGGDRSMMIKPPKGTSLKTTEGKSDIEESLTQMSIAGRKDLLNRYEKQIKGDAGKAPGYKEWSDSEAAAGKKTIEALRDKYIGKTEIKEGKTSISIDSKGEMNINGKPVQVDSDSSYVKLGGGGRGSSVGGMYGGGHFDGQLQGGTYVGMANILKRELMAGRSIKEAISSLKGNNADSETNKRDIEKFVSHLGLK